jgi:hypothetical protein
MTRNRILVAVGVGLVLLAGIAAAVALSGGDEPAQARPEPTTTTDGPPESTTTTEPPIVYPLTGLPADDQAMLERPLLIVKIDNVDSYARPQAGVNQADVVYEEQVEGGVTRFAALFHSQDAEQVGPVRSARTTDIGIGASFGRPLFAFSGANQVFMDLIRASPLIDLSYDWHPELYTRVPDREAPDDIFTPTSVLYGADPGDATSPPQLFEFRGADEELFDSAVRVPGVSFFTGGAGAPTSFTWDRDLKGWRRDQNGTAHVDTSGTVIAPENVIIQFAEYVDTGIRDLAGSPVPEAQLTGEGGAWVLTRGHLIEARWKRPTPEDLTTFETLGGTEIPLTPGQTWVALLPPGTAEYAPCPEESPVPPGC